MQVRSPPRPWPSRTPTTSDAWTTSTPELHPTGATPSPTVYLSGPTAQVDDLAAATRRTAAAFAGLHLAPTTTPTAPDAQTVGHPDTPTSAPEPVLSPAQLQAKAIADQRRTQILEALRTGPCTTAELVATTAIPRSAIQRRLTELRDAGQITRDDQTGTYRLTAAEEAA